MYGELSAFSNSKMEGIKNCIKFHADALGVAKTRLKVRFSLLDSLSTKSDIETELLA